MVGTLQVLRSIPHPSSQIVQEALNLLAAMGGGSKTVKTLLKEMKVVQDNNESVLAEAKATIAEANNRDQEVSDREAALVQRTKQAEATIIGRYEEVVRKEEDLSLKMSQAAEDFRVKTVELEEQAEKLKQNKQKADQEISEGMARLKEWESQLADRTVAMEQLEADAVIRMKKIERVEQDLDIKHKEVEAFKSKLDARDERLRTVMDSSGDDV